jgi:RNA polymerase sigma-70 factor (ECF subfamily)
VRTEDGYIVNKCLNGESEAFGLLVDKYKGGIYAFVHAKLNGSGFRNFQDAQDVTQEVFIKAYEKLRSLRRWGSFLSWLYCIADTQCKAFIRKQAGRPDREFIEDQNPKTLKEPYTDSHREGPMLALLREALDSLSEKHRQILTLHYLGGMSGQEIARFLRISPTNVWQRLSRARSKLKDELLAMMSTTFEQKRLEAGFTIRIVETVRRIRIHPMPGTPGLPWGLSVAAGIILTALGLSTHPDLPNPLHSLIDLSTPSEMAVAENSEIPVDLLKISQMPTILREDNETSDSPRRAEQVTLIDSDVLIVSNKQEVKGNMLPEEATVQQWKYQMENRLKMPLGWIAPLVSDGIVYTMDSHTLYGLEGATGALIWNMKLDASRPVVVDGTLYVSDRSNGVAYALDARNGRATWRSELGVTLGRSQIVDGDIVYVWSNRPIDTPDAHNTLYALSRDTGSLLWQHNLGARTGYSSPIRVADGIVYTLSIASPTWDDVEKRWVKAQLCTLFALDGMSGTLLWESNIPFAYSYHWDADYTTSGYAPVVVNGKVYVVDTDGYLYALSGTSGSVLWCSEVKCEGHSPFLSDGAIYIPSDDGLYMFDPKSGLLHGELTFGEGGGRPSGWSREYTVAETDGVVYACMERESSEYTLYAFSGESKTKLWQYRMPRRTRSSFSVVAGVVYFAAGMSNNYLYTLDGKSGQLLEKYELERSTQIVLNWDSWNYSDPTVADGFIYVCAEHQLYALNTSGVSPFTGAFDIDEQVAIGRDFWLKGELESAAAILRTVVDKKPNVSAAWVLLAEIAEQSGRNADAIAAWNNVSEYASPLDEDYRKSMQSLTKLTGLRWKVKPIDDLSDVVLTKDMLYVGGLDVVHVLERETGELMDQYPNATLLPYVYGGPVYLHLDGRLHALKAESADVLWTYDIRSLRSQYFTYVLDQTIFIEDEEAEKLYALSAESGELLWQSRTRGWFLSGFDRVIYTNDWTVADRLNAISAETGELLWSYDARENDREEKGSIYTSLGNSIGVQRSGFAASCEGIYIATYVVEPNPLRDRYIDVVLVALDNTTGEVRWKYNTGIVTNFSRIEVGDNGMVYVSGVGADGDIHAVDGKNGEFLWKQAGALCSDVTGRVIYANAVDGIKALDAEDGHILWHFGPGNIGGALLSDKGTLYIGEWWNDVALYAIDADTGTPLWDYKVGGVPIAVLDGTLYLNDDGRSISALDIGQASVKLRQVSN